MSTDRLGTAGAQGDAPPLLPEAPTVPRQAHPHAPAATPEQVQRALQEARTVTATAQGGQVELQLGHFCNNRCVFCGSGQLTERGLADPIPEAAVLAALQAVADQGIRRVTFLGGEPTIQDSFLPGVQAAVRLGFSEIVVFTNGARLWDERFVAAVEAAVRGGSHRVELQWRVSLQGGDEASHDRAVGRKGAFAKILRGLELVRSHHRPVTVNMCLTSGSVATLPDLAGVLLAHGVRQVCIDMVRPISAGERTQSWMRAILPRFSALAEPMRLLVSQLHQSDSTFDVNLTHVPYCVAPDLARHIHHGGEATVTFTADLAERQGVMDKYAFQATDRRRMDRCSTCVFAWRCTGVTHQYLDWYGEEEFTPQSAASLKASGALPAAIVDVVRTALGDLPVGVPVGPWRLLSAVFDARLPRAELRWGRAGSRELGMGIGPEGAALRPGRVAWWRFDGGQVDLAPGEFVPTVQELQTFADWLEQRLGPGELQAAAAVVERVSSNYRWLVRAVGLLASRLQGLSWRPMDAQLDLAWEGEGGPRWLRLAADAVSPVGHRELCADLAMAHRLASDTVRLEEISQALGQCLRLTRLSQQAARSR